MRKFLLTLAVVASALTANAQEEGGFYGNKFFDNCYIGVNGGVGSGTTHQAVFKNVNWNLGLRLGKYFSPIFGFGIEGNLYFNNRHGSYVKQEGGHSLSGGNTIHYSNLGFFATINLTNAIKEYLGEPRKFEVSFVPGFSWGHNFGNNPAPEGTKMNTLNNKIAFDFAYNFGKFQEWQLYFEPSINYCIAGVDHENDEKSNKIVKYNINNSFLQFNVGLVYKFKTSNGAHNFMLIESCDPMELDELNASINDLRAKDSLNNITIDNLQKEVKDLQDALNECNSKPAVAQQTSFDPGLPAIFYQVNKSVITPAQQQNVQIIAEILKNHPTYSIKVRGYASPEGSSSNNNTLAVNRAYAVKTMLINKYGIPSYRIEAEGCGATDQLFEVYEFNRCAIVILEKK
ncbi:MAG: OmpA family protein [Prevotella sp.]|nr:OmpA family protein [Prevotella sp.]